MYSQDKPGHAAHSGKEPVVRKAWHSGHLGNKMCKYWLCICMHLKKNLFFRYSKLLIKLAQHYKRLQCGQLWKDHSSACQRGQRLFDLGSLLYMCTSVCACLRVCVCVSSRKEWFLSSGALEVWPDPFKVKLASASSKGPGKTNSVDSQSTSLHYSPASLKPRVKSAPTPPINPG